MASLIEHIYQFKRGSSSRWNELNLILKEGEPGFETDTGKFKFGNGKTRWNKLPYITDVKEIVFDNELQEAIEAVKKEIIDNIPTAEIDNYLSNSSTNPVQNKVIKIKFDNIDQWCDTTTAVLNSHTNALKTIEPRLKFLEETNKHQTAILGIINAKDFGAIGDGKSHTVEQVYGSVELAQVDYPTAENLHDEIDGLAIEKALHFAESTERPLYIPTGEYLISKTISTHKRVYDSANKKWVTGPGQSSRINVYGDGLGTRFITTDTFDGDYVFYFDVAATQPRQLWVHDFDLYLWADVSGIYLHEIGMGSTIENICIRYIYPKHHEDTNYRKGIYCKSSTVSTFRNIKIVGKISKNTSKTNDDGFTGLFYGPRNIGIMIAEAYSTRIVECDIIFCKWALYLNSGSNNTIELCRIDENDFGIYQNGFFYDPEKPNSGYMIETRAELSFTGTLAGLTIRQNRFESNNQYSIFLAGYGTAESYKNKAIIISENYFDHLGRFKAMHTTRSVFRKGIHLYHPIGVVIENNLIKGKEYDEAEKESPVQNFGGSGAKDVSIRGNVCMRWANGKITNEDGTTQTKHEKTYTGIGPNILSSTGFVNDIEKDQSTRGISGVTAEQVDEAISTAMGDIDTALDVIIAIQETLIGGAE